MLRNQIDCYLTDPNRVTVFSDRKEYEIDFDDLIETLEDDGFENLDRCEVLLIVIERLSNVKDMFNYE